MFAVVLLVTAAPGARAQADTPPASDPAPATDAGMERSPWLFAPVFNSSPKLGTSLGVLGGYLHFFDEKSRPSIFAVTGQYSSTKSLVAGAFAKTSSGEDHHRVLAALMMGNVKNDYDDYLGTGLPLRNEADLRSFFFRYTGRVSGDWFVGGQAMYQNFAITGQTDFDDQVLNVLGIQPYTSAGAGLVVQHDSRDNENIPTRGGLANFNNMAFRESLGGDNDYDVYRVEFRHFVPQAGGHVFAMRQLNHLTRDAPAAVRAPVQLRGYKVGQYTGEYMSSFEGEERFRLGEKWTATVFAGLACLYGGGQRCNDGTNLYAAGGGGVQYLLKPKEGIVLNLEYAAGESGAYGIYLKMGYAY